MPKVGSREFPYTKEGMQAAELYSRAVNKPVENMQEGGETKRSFGDTWRAGKEKFGSLLSNMRNKKATSPSVEESSPMLNTTDDGRLMSFTDTPGYNQDWSGARGIPMSEARKQDAREFVRSFDPSDHIQVGNLQMYINRMIDEGMLQGDKLAEDGMFGRKTEAMLRQLQGKEQEVDVPMLAEQDVDVPGFQPYPLDETEVPMQQGGDISDIVRHIGQTRDPNKYPFGSEGAYLDTGMPLQEIGPDGNLFNQVANIVGREEAIRGGQQEAMDRVDRLAEERYQKHLGTLFRKVPNSVPKAMQDYCSLGYQTCGLIDKVGFQTGGYVPTFGHKKGGK